MRSAFVQVLVATCVGTEEEGFSFVLCLDGIAAWYEGLALGILDHFLAACRLLRRRSRWLQQGLLEGLEDRVDQKADNQPEQEADKHDRHHKRHPRKERHPPYYPHRHEDHHYHTYYLSPIHRHYIPHGYRLRHLPHGYVRILIGGFPYFYFSGVFYRHYHDGYIVVGAPIGAVVYDLPIGFIAFTLGAFTYYYVNDTYYLWDDDEEAYVVVRKPDGADDAIAAATDERLYVYPNLGQSQEQQSRDRYECHRWAVHETGVDPSLWDEYEITAVDRNNYKRAISACLEGRGYTVK